MCCVVSAELKHTLHNMGEQLSEEEIEEMMMEADTDGDGQISFPGLWLLLLPFCVVLTLFFYSKI